MMQNRTTYPGLAIDREYEIFERNCEMYPKSRVRLVPIEQVFEDYNGVD